MEEGELELPTPEQAEQSKTIRAQMAKLQSALDTQTPELDTRAEILGNRGRRERIAMVRARAGSL